MVYWASSSPIRNRYHVEEKIPLVNPEPFTNPATLSPFGVELKLKIDPRLVCSSGTRIRTPTTIATPITCHHTLTLLNNATRLTPNVFSNPWTARITVYVPTKISFVTCTSNAMFMNAATNAASPKSMPAVMATCPRRLNQPVNQAHAGPLLFASFADQ